MRVSRGEGRVMLNLFTHIPPLFFLTLNASLVASTHSRHRHGCTQPHHSTPSVLSRSYFTPSIPPFSLAPTFAPFLPLLAVHLLRNLSGKIKNIACRVLYIYGLRCLFGVLPLYISKVKLFLK